MVIMRGESDITPALENYLEAIYILQKVRERVKVNDIAKYLDVKMPSVTYNMKKLEEHGLIHHRKRSHVELTPAGERIARSVHRKHEEFFRFFHDILGVPREIADEDACKIEHVLHTETMNRLTRFLQWVTGVPEKWSYQPEMIREESHRDGKAS